MYVCIYVYMYIYIFGKDDNGPPGGIPVTTVRDSYFIAEQPAPAPHLSHPQGCAALRIVLVTVLRVSHYCEIFPERY